MSITSDDLAPEVQELLNKFKDHPPSVESTPNTTVLRDETGNVTVNSVVLDIASITEVAADSVELAFRSGVSQPLQFVAGQQASRALIGAVKVHTGTNTPADANVGDIWFEE